ncbi:MAG: precorrin-3B C(17)-methyltransferase [Pseudomonadota bacterium]
MALTPAVICVSASGAETARRIADLFEAPLHGREGRVKSADVLFPNVLDHARDLFAAGTPLIGVCAAGILIRAVAPLLADKRLEPPVLAVSEDGQSVVPLLGGHRGANVLARQIADALVTTPAITTAGDRALGVALDVPPTGYRLANPEDAKAAMAALLSGAGLRQEGERIFGIPDRNGAESVTLKVTSHPATGGPVQLVYHPQRYTLGVGSARGASPEGLQALAESMLAKAGIAPGALAAIGSVDIKADEPAVLNLAAAFDLPLRVFSPQELEAETPRLANPSETVFAEVGCHGVAEGSALALAGPEGHLVVEKQKTHEATCALAVAPAPFVEALPGHPRGHLALVGIGPGKAAWRTPEVSKLIADADDLVGYGLYLDLLGPLGVGKRRHDFPLGGEEARCRFALEEASKGRRVALVCSGDAGIYAMGALIFELLDRGAVSEASKRVEVVSAPGVSALQAAAAKAGAPLGHDFCAISLSDLLTPRDDIVRRIHAAAEGDFVIAFYNPVSKTRRTLLSEARNILLDHRPVDCPVLLASSLGREAEALHYRRLCDLTVDEVDMLTVVIVGSSQSRLFARGEGPAFYTPRGYAKKQEVQL